jgi:hypothetical protein
MPPETVSGFHGAFLLPIVRDSLLFGKFKGTLMSKRREWIRRLSLSTPVTLFGCASSMESRKVDAPAAPVRTGRGQAAAKREFEEKFLASGAGFRFPPHPAHGRVWTPDLQAGYDSFKHDPRVGYAVKNLRSGTYLAAHNADEQKFGGSMPKPAVAAVLLEARQGNLTRDEWMHIVQVCDRSVNASWKALLGKFTHADEQAFERKYGLPDVGIRANTQSPRFYAEFFERCVNYRLDYGCEILLEAMRRSQFGRGRWNLPGSIAYIGGKTGTYGEYKHEGLFFVYRGTPYAIVVYAKGGFGRGSNYWKMGALFGGLFREYIG